MSTASEYVLVSLAGVTTLKQPKDISFEWFDLSKSGRATSGMMAIDIIAKKKKFSLSYEVISGPQLEAILAIVDSWDPFYEFVYKQNGVQKTVTVYSGAKKAQKFRTDGVWYWKGFAFDLIEQ